MRVLDAEVLRRLMLHERKVLRKVGVRENTDGVQHGRRVMVRGEPGRDGLTRRKLQPQIIRNLKTQDPKFQFFNFFFSAVMWLEVCLAMLQ